MQTKNLKQRNLQIVGSTYNKLYIERRKDMSINSKQSRLEKRKRQSMGTCMERNKFVSRICGLYTVKYIMNDFH